MQGGFLLQEVVHDDVNAMVLASWIRQQLERCGRRSSRADQVNEIRTSMGKDPLEHEAQILAESDAAESARRCRASIARRAPGRRVALSPARSSAPSRTWCG
jgi:hypothetical protein